MKVIKYMIVLLMGSSLLTACVDTDLTEVLDPKNNYQTVNDADNAVLGAYGSFMKLGKQLVVLNELRGDLVDVTTNASTDLQQINSKTPDTDNAYADPTPFYTVIMNCNDALANFDKMKAKGSLTDDEYKELYSDLTGLRCYTYLQLGVQFGNIPYITEPLNTISEVKAVVEKQETISLDALVDSLINNMESLYTNIGSGALDNYQNSDLVNYTLDGYNLSTSFINKHLLLGDLYMWKNGKSYWTKAATEYYKVLGKYDDEAVTANYQYYHCNSQTTNTSLTFGTGSYFQILYLRYHEDDILSMGNFWVKMFQDLPQNKPYIYEWMWSIPYDKDFAPTYPFTALFNTTTEGGDYQLMASSYAVDSLWNNQQQTNGFNYDARGEGSSFEKQSDGTYAIRKYKYRADEDDANDGNLFLYRAAQIHLRYAEAANRCGYPKVAYALLNNGVQSEFDYSDAADGSENYISGYGPNNYYPAPFYLDARFDTDLSIRSPWRYNMGIRGRACLTPRTYPSESDMEAEGTDSIHVMEKYLIDESALECGFEGYRWYDLIRIAHRLNQEGKSGGDFLTKQLAGKYSRSSSAVPTYTDDESTWFLKFKW